MPARISPCNWTTQRRPHEGAPRRDCRAPQVSAAHRPQLHFPSVEQRTRHPETTAEHYQAFTTHGVDIDGEAFHVRVHWAQRDVRMVVVGLDVRAFFSPPENPAMQAILQGDSGLHFLGGEVTTSAFRSVRFAEVAEESRRELVRSLGAIPVAPGEEAGRAALTETVEGTKRRPGPKPVVSDEVLAQVVAPPRRTPRAAGSRWKRCGKPWWRRTCRVSVGTSLGSRRARQLSGRGE